MSSVGHIVVGLASGRYAFGRFSGLRQVTFAILLTAIAFAPDLDLRVLPALGVPDSVTLGHRGATHSLVIALAMTLLVAVLARAARLPVRRMAVAAFLAVGSHAILDTFSPGPGVAWLWPFTPFRFPTFPILPEAPFPQPTINWIMMLLAEMLVFSPVLVYAILPRRPPSGADPNPSPDQQGQSRRPTPYAVIAIAIAAVLTALLVATAWDGTSTTTPSGSPEPQEGLDVALGVWSGQPWEPANLDAVTDLLGGSPAIFLTYQSWSTRSFHAPDMAQIANRGAAHVVTWQPDGYTLHSIASGEHDAFVRSWAAGAAAWGETIYLRPMHEMNGDWYSWGRGVNGNTAAEFVAAWRHLHDIFVDEGATNVIWIWSPNVRYGAEYPLADLYPGAAYVDWVGLDGYNWGTDRHLATPRWQLFGDVFGATYREVTLTVAPGKPVMIVETASTEHGGDKAAWIRDAFGTAVPGMSNIKAVIWFNEADGPSDFRINSSDASLEALKSVFHSTAYSAQLP